MTIGLRERKKLKTRAAIQTEALRLFLDRGFDETTVEDIAEAAEISPSTFFNYFRTKEDVVFTDELDPLILEAFNALPDDVSPVAAVRSAMRTVFSNLTPEQDKVLRQRMQILATTPQLRSAMLSQYADLVDQIAELVAGRAGRSAADFSVQNLAGAMLGVLMSAMLNVVRDPRADMFRRVDEALAHLEAGLPLDWRRRRR